MQICQIETPEMKPGHYWVRGAAGVWVPARYDADGWHLLGDPRTFSGADFERRGVQIGPLIEAPETEGPPDGHRVGGDVYLENSP